jgi:hypothetical protein
METKVKVEMDSSRAHKAMHIKQTHMPTAQPNLLKEHVFPTHGLTAKIKHENTTRNIRKPGDVGILNFCTFTQNINGLTSWSFEIPASAYCHPLGLIKNRPFQYIR